MPNRASHRSRVAGGAVTPAPAGVQALNMLGPLAKGLAFVMGKQPEEEQHPRGFLGLEWDNIDAAKPERAGLRVRRVLDGSPAAKAGLKTGDQVLRIHSRGVDSIKAVRTALAEIREGDTVSLVIRRGSGAEAREIRLVISAGEGL